MFNPQMGALSARQQMQEALGLGGNALAPGMGPQGRKQQQPPQPGQPQPQGGLGDINLNLTTQGVPGAGTSLGQLGQRYGLGQPQGQPAGGYAPPPGGQQAPQGPQGPARGPAGPSAFAVGGRVGRYAQGGEVEPVPTPYEKYKIFLAQRKARGYARGGHVSLAVRRK